MPNATSSATAGGRHCGGGGGNLFAFHARANKQICSRVLKVKIKVFICGCGVRYQSREVHLMRRKDARALPSRTPKQHTFIYNAKLIADRNICNKNQLQYNKIRICLYIFNLILYYYYVVFVAFVVCLRVC